jgi:hypothetical protein
LIVKFTDKVRTYTRKAVMKKFVAWLFAFLVLVAVAGVFFYKYYLPEMVAAALVKEEEQPYIPKFVQARIKKYKEPVNKGAEDVIREIHRSQVTLQQILETIDRTEPEQVQAMLDELSDTRIVSEDQVFDIGKKYIRADFDVEVLRVAFKENVDTSMIRKGLRQAEYHRNEVPIDPDMAKAIVKQVLIQKEKEYKRAMHQD